MHDLDLFSSLPIQLKLLGSFFLFFFFAKSFCEHIFYFKADSIPLNYVRQYLYLDNMSQVALKFFIMSGYN
jgi:hypothetical protein